MPEATQRPWGYVHHKGLDKHLVGAVNKYIHLENVATVEDRHGNAKENAEFIVKAVNNHDALVSAVERLVDTVDVRASEFSTHSIQFQMSVTKARAALEQVK